MCGGKEDYGVRESGDVQNGTGGVVVSRHNGKFCNGEWGAVREGRVKVKAGCYHVEGE